MIGADGSQIGVISRDDALQRAREAGLDLVVVAESAKPPVAKIIAFTKFKYQQQQKEAQGKKKAKTVEIKEVRLTPFMAEGDFEQRLKKAAKFLEGGDKVRLTVKFVGRQITRKEFGENLLNKAIEGLSAVSKVEFPPKMQGKLLFTQLQPITKKKT